MTDHLELIDIVKTLLALGAGLLLGLERELKDKAAGLKTISIICLGATLFSIISYKVGGFEDTRIASYIVSGVGFIGAGVIFKDNLTVSGLTTAGIIWLAAAIGTGIGFGEFYLSGIVLVAALGLIYFSSLLNRLLKLKRQSRQLEFEIDHSKVDQKDRIYTELQQLGVKVEEKRIDLKDERIKFTVEIMFSSKRVHALKEYLLRNDLIKGFSLYGAN